MPPSPKRPGLELLIRRKDGEGGGIQLRVLPADRAFLKLRPVALADAVVEVNTLVEATGKAFILRMREGGDHIRLSEHEYGIWLKMDGRHTIQDLATEMVFQYGRYDFDEIRRCLVRLRALGLVFEPESRVVRVRGGYAGERVRSLALAISEFDHRWEDVDAGFQRLFRLLRPLFARASLPVLGSLCVVGLVLWLVARASGWLSAAPLSPWAYGLAFILSLPLFMAFHEIAHGLACKAHGRRVKAVGLTLSDYVLPTVYVDVTDMFMCSRRARVSVDLAGPLCNLLLATLAIGLASALPPAAMRSSLVLVADVNIALALFTAWPFHGFREDGYQVLSEATATTLLRARTWARVRALVLRRASTLATPATPTAIYLVGFVSTWAALLALFAAFAWRWVVLSP